MGNFAIDGLTQQPYLPTVSVIIPIYNGAADLPELLACLQAQTYPAPLVEYLLVDNASRDQTPQLLAAAVVAAATWGGQLQHLSEAEIQSSYAARNRGIRAAQGDILAFTDADCRPQPDWLYNLVQPFAQDGIGLVAGEVASLPGTTLLERYAERQQFLTQTHTLAHAFYPYGQTANLAVRRQILAQVGLFRPYLTTGGDADLCWRIQQQTAYQIHFAEAAIVRHRHRATWQDLRQQWRRYGQSNRYLHDLHGVSLMPGITWPNITYRLARWLLREGPPRLGQVLLGRRLVIDLLDQPIALFCARQRWLGQQTAQLPPQAAQIEWLHQPCAAEITCPPTPSVP